MPIEKFCKHGYMEWCAECSPVTPGELALLSEMAKTSVSLSSLLPWLHHQPQCPASKKPVEGDCDCGLDKVLENRLKVALRDDVA